MKITGVETFVVGTFHKNARRHWLLLKLLTDEGLYGLGDASLHAYDGEIESIIRQWVDRYLVGQDPLHHERHWTRLYQDTPARGGPLGSTALSGLDIALWDLKGKALGRPVYELLGGPIRQELRVYANGWYTNPGTPEQNAAEAREVVARGFDAMKFDPFGQHNYYTISPREAQLAEDRVAAVREAVGPDIMVAMDCHWKYAVNDAILLAQALEPYDLLWLEDPVPPENIEA